VNRDFPFALHRSDAGCGRIGPEAVAFQTMTSTMGPTASPHGQADEFPAGVTSPRDNGVG
jgi:hypothetical protein